MDVRYEITGMPGPADLEYGEIYQVQLHGTVAPPDSGDVLVRLIAVPQTDTERIARMAYAKAASSLETDRGLLAVAAAALLIAERLEPAGDALRDTDGGSSRPDRERLVRDAGEQGAAFHAVLRAVVTDLGHDPADPAVVEVITRRLVNPDGPPRSTGVPR